MQKFSAILLLCILHLQPAINASIWLDYFVNFEYIKEVLCINKDKPELHCDGKCYLSQQLKENQSPQEKDELPLTKILKLEFIIVSSHLKETKNVSLSTSQTNLPIYILPFYKTVNDDIFHPPRLV